MGASSTGRRAGLTHQLILDEAVYLSEHQGVDGWTMRDIADRLGVVPSVLYHYFPNKDALCDAVVDHVCADIPLPDEHLQWKDWFTALAHSLRPVLLRYHGITDRFARGKFTPRLLPALDAAFRQLDGAGFGDKSALAYSIITNTVIHTIGARNLRSVHQPGQRHDLTTMLERFEPLADTSPGLRALVDLYLGPLATPELEDRLSAEYFNLVIAAMLDGIEHVLLPQAKPLPPGASAPGSAHRDTK
ncbi:TetR/AcrR family transcriptional regulator [Corynebacterium uterequi]|uniref:Transcriptional regulator, TetR family n=1 Tax=Corynebacterium uterequi TaxID=1072256 RepID=A0A0G3HLT6_9CORY|nr:TetR/AcrR family transcriptional regulator [Corynebacterium uterequi]AKK12092.1 transcriptional regulator, TetR family [Corynebacterium uterequi]